MKKRAFFIPMHQQPALNNIGLFEGEHYPVAEELARQGMYLPSSTGLSEDEIRHICRVIKEVKEETK